MTPGKETSEYEVTKSAAKMGKFMAILGGIVVIGAALLAAFTDALGAEAKVIIIGGAIVAVAGAVEDMLVALGYQKARAETKAAEALKKD